MEEFIIRHIEKNHKVLLDQYIYNWDDTIAEIFIEVSKVLDVSYDQIISALKRVKRNNQLVFNDDINIQYFTTTANFLLFSEKRFSSKNCTLKREGDSYYLRTKPFNHIIGKTSMFCVHGYILTTAFYIESKYYKDASFYMKEHTIKNYMLNFLRKEYPELRINDILPLCF
jgi:hypothetical protein